MATDTSITLAFISDSVPGGTFPQVKDSARILPNGSIRAARDIPLCSLELDPNALGWEEVETPIQSRYLKAVALRLPPGFRPSWYSHPKDSDDDDPEALSDSGDYWGHLLGSWDTIDRRSFDARPSHLSIWIGPDEGYPRSGVGGAEASQVTFRECSVQTALGPLPVALFQVQSSAPRLGGYYVVTYAKIQNSVYIQAMGTTPDSASQGLLLSSLATLRMVPSP